MDAADEPAMTLIKLVIAGLILHQAGHDEAFAGRSRQLRCRRLQERAG
jgi:hypothetical protein